MPNITVKNKATGAVIASSQLGKGVLSVEGNYYFSRENVDFAGLTKVSKAYHCPIKNSDCDYYYLSDQSGKKMDRELCWIYEEIDNSLFKQIAGKVGFYTTPPSNGSEVITE